MFRFAPLFSILKPAHVNANRSRALRVTFNASLRVSCYGRGRPSNGIGSISVSANARMTRLPIDARIAPTKEQNAARSSVCTCARFVPSQVRTPMAAEHLPRYDVLPSCLPQSPTYFVNVGQISSWKPALALKRVRFSVLYYHALPP